MALILPPTELEAKLVVDLKYLFQIVQNITVRPLISQVHVGPDAVFLLLSHDKKHT